MKKRKQTENESDYRKRDFIHLIEKKSKFVMKNRLLKSETEFCIDKNLQILAFKGRKTVLLLASSHNCRFIISLFLHHAEIILSIWSRALKPFHNDAIYCSPFCSPCLGTIGRSYQEREWKTAQSNGEFPEDDTSPGNESQLIRPNCPLKRLQFIIPPKLTR